MPSPEVERQVSPVPEKEKVVPESLENDTGVMNVKEPQLKSVVDSKGQILTESQADKEKDILKLQKSIDEYKKDKKTSIFDTIAWNARVVLRRVAQYFFKGKKVEVEGGA